MSAPTKDRPQHCSDTKLVGPAQSGSKGDHVKLDDWLPYALHRVVVTWQARFSARLEFLGLTFEQWRVLLVTSQTGPQNIRALSDATLISYSTLQRWLDRMEGNGLIERRTIEDDGRSVEIVITEKGLQIFSEALRISLNDADQVLSGFSPLEYHAFLDFLRRLQANIAVALPREL